MLFRWIDPPTPAKVQSLECNTAVHLRHICSDPFKRVQDDLAAQKALAQVCNLMCKAEAQQVRALDLPGAFPKKSAGKEDL